LTRIAEEYGNLAAVAWAHLIFDLVAATLGFLLLQTVMAWATRIVRA
jgi:Na+/phosphate symporter